MRCEVTGGGWRRSPAWGALLGAMCGDAAGAPLEFGGLPTDEAVHRAMWEMPGGGAHSVAPGQCTDDTELMLALVHAIRGLAAAVRGQAYGDALADASARAYGEWHASMPFDMGVTCRRAFGFHPPDVTAAAMRAKAAALNANSEANGALMRITPLAVHFALHVSSATLEDISEYARLDAQLSHPSAACQDCNALFCAALASLVRDPDPCAQQRGRNALAVVGRLAEACDGKVRVWVADALAMTPRAALRTYDAQRNCGHVKHAFTLALAAVHLDLDYPAALRETLLCGGDTDTNAAIVGALAGAARPDTVPAIMADKVLGFDCASHDPCAASLLGHRRPEVYRASNALALLRSTP